MPPSVIRAMQKSEIDAIGQLASRIWHSHYPSVISQAQIDYMLSLMYSPDALARQIQDGHRFEVLDEQGLLTGFVSTEKQDGFLHVHKLYVDQERAGAGRGSALINHVVRQAGNDRLRLYVNRRNWRSVNFYFRHGFVIARLLDTKIGNGFMMEDFVMERTGLAHG